MPSRAWRALLVAPGLLAGAAALAAAGTTDGDATPAAGASAVIVFASVGQGFRLPAATVDLRAEAERLLGEACTRLGRPPVAAARVEALQRQWRVRSDGALYRGFTRAVAENLGASPLVVARIMVYPGRLLVSVRSLDPLTGRLLWADAAEGATPDPGRDAATTDGAPWLAAVRQACDHLDDRWCLAPDSSGAPLLPLPTRTLGVEPLHGETATACLLGGFLRDGGWSLIDPGVVMGALLEAGAGADGLDARACATLRTAFGEAPALVTDLVSWQQDPRLTPAAAEAGDGRAGFAPFVLAVRTVDTGTACIRSRAERHRAAEAPYGWFGRRRTSSLLERYRGAAAALVIETRHTPEER